MYRYDDIKNIKLIFFITKKKNPCMNCYERCGLNE